MLAETLHSWRESRTSPSLSPGMDSAQRLPSKANRVERRVGVTFAGEPDKHCLCLWPRSTSTVKNSVDSLCSRYNAVRMAFFCVLPSQNTSPCLIMRKTSEKFYKISDSLETVKVIKNKGSLRTCHGQEGTQRGAGNWDLNKGRVHLIIIYQYWFVSSSKCTTVM